MPAPSPRSVWITRKRRSTSRSVSDAVGSSRIRIFELRADRLGDFHDLLLRHAERAHRALGRDIGAGALQQFARLAIARLPIHLAPEPRALQRERDVFRDREVREQCGLLVDRGDPQRARRAPGVLCGTRWPSIMSVPESAVTAPVITLISVDFPAPFSPSSACTSPARSSNETPFSACTPGEGFGDCGGVEQCHRVRPAVPEFPAPRPFAWSWPNTPPRGGPLPAASDTPGRQTVCRARSSHGVIRASAKRRIPFRESAIFPFQGACLRLWFSSQIPSHGKSACFHTYPIASRDAGEKAAKNASPRAGSIRCVVKPPENGAAWNTRMSSVPPSLRGAQGQSNSAPARR